MRVHSCNLARTPLQPSCALARTPVRTGPCNLAPTPFASLRARPCNLAQRPLQPLRTHPNKHHAYWQERLCAQGLATLRTCPCNVAPLPLQRCPDALATFRSTGENAGVQYASAFATMHKAWKLPILEQKATCAHGLTQAKRRQSDNKHDPSSGISKHVHFPTLTWTNSASSRCNCTFYSPLLTRTAGCTRGAH